MNENLISVIIPVYNVQDYLEKCLNSVINQTYKNLEIICINDGSTDNSAEILQKYAQADERITVYTNENRGLAATRNFGVEVSKGEYICFLDSDDWLANDFCEKLYKKCKHHNADVSVGMAQYYWNKKRISTDQWVNQKAFASNKEILETIEDKANIIYSCACWNKLYRADFIKNNNIRFPENIVVEDVPFTFQTAILANKIVVEKTANIFYRQRHDSIMAKMSKSKICFDILKIYEYIDKIFETMNIKPCEKKEYKKILDNFKIFNLYRYLCACNDLYKEEFYKEFRKVLKNIKLEDNQYVSKQTKKIHKLCLKCSKYSGFSKRLKSNNTFIHKIFSLKNEKRNETKWKVLTLFGVKFKIRIFSPKYIYEPQKLKKMIDDAQIVSFDIFDTLLLRPYVKPTDLFLHIEKNFGAKGFADARTNAEKFARTQKELSFQEETTYDEIYDCIDEEYKHFKEVELNYEETLLFRNEEMFEYYKYALDKGKEIVLTSDMYLPKEFLEHVLAKNGINGYKKFYLSSDIFRTKSSGSIYKYIIEDIKTSGDNCLHIGDNLFSDVIQAKQHGFSAFYYEKIIDRYLKQSNKARLLLEQNPENIGASIILMQFATNKRKFETYWNKIGYIYSGPVCYGYCKWLAMQAEKDGISDMLFVARDGYTLDRVFKLFDTKTCESHYIYAPRFLSAICCLNYKKDRPDIMNSIIEYYKPNFNKIMEVEAKNLCSNEEKYDFLLKYKSNFELFAEEEQKNYENYLSQYIKDKNSNIAVVDTITEKFSSQRLLENVLERTITGYYWCLLPLALKCGYEGKYRDYFPDYKCEKSLYCWDFMELLMTAPQYPIQSVEDGLPIFKNPVAKEEEFRKSIANYISDSSVEFAQDLLAKFKNIPVELSHKEVADMINILAWNPDNDDLNYLNQVKHAYDAEHSRYIDLFDNWKKLKKSTPLRRFLKKAGKIFYNKQKDKTKNVTRLRIFGIEVYKKKVKDFKVKKSVLGITYSRKLDLKGLLEAQKAEILSQIRSFAEDLKK